MHQNDNEKNGYKIVRIERREEFLKKYKKTFNTRRLVRWISLGEQIADFLLPTRSEHRGGDITKLGPL